MDLDVDDSYASNVNDDLEEDTDENDGSDEIENDDDSEEYYEEDEYEDIESDEQDNSLDDTSEEEDKEEEYYEEDEYEEEEYTEPSQNTDKINPLPTSQKKNISNQQPLQDEFEPIKVSKLIKATRKQKKPEQQQLKEEPYQANADHYYDDILPEILDDIQTNKLETIAKIIGGIILLCFVMWYLIYFL